MAEAKKDIEPINTENSEVDEEISNFFSEDILSENKYELWSKHGGYLLFYIIRRFFSTPRKKIPKKDLNLIDHVGNLLQAGDTDPDTVQKCDHFIALQRHMENTSARKRLERWAKYVISIYLIVVLCLLLLNGGLLSKYCIALDISDELMIVILSTTTINIIGIGLIVLRGHFYNVKSKANKVGGIEQLEE